MAMLRLGNGAMYTVLALVVVAGVLDLGLRMARVHRVSDPAPA